MGEYRSRRSMRGAAPIARHGRLTTSNPVLAAIRYVAAALAIVLASTAVVGGVAVWSVADSIKPGVTLIDETAGPPPDIGSIEGGLNFLLIGSDSGENDPRYGNRKGAMLNDANLLLHISEDHSSATVVSFPRDMFVPIPSCPRPDGTGSQSALRSAKLNTTLSRGGLACTVHTVSEFTGLDIPFAAKLEMNGVVEMADAIGGVDVCVAKAINDRQIHLKLDVGTHTLYGDQAQLFLRSRYGISGGSDLGRINNQYVFLSALMRKVKTAEVLTDPFTLLKLAQTAADNMELSNSLKNINTLVSIALVFKDIPLENINFVQYPTTYGESGGLSGVLPSRALGDKLISAIKNDSMIQLAGPGEGVTLSDEQPETEEPTPPASGEPSSSASPPPTHEVVTLPGAVSGQSAAQVTCSRGQTAGG